MTTIKSYTNIKQSRKLAEFLPLESADMYYFGIDDYPNSSKQYHEILIGKIDKDDIDEFGHIPCWSLAALLNYLREIDFFPEIEADEHGVTMSINYYDEEEARLLAPVHNIKVKAESFIDACVSMIEKLHEQKLL